MEAPLEVGAWVSEQFRGAGPSSRLERGVLAKSLQLEDHEASPRGEGAAASLPRAFH